MVYIICFMNHIKNTISSFRVTHKKIKLENYPDFFKISKIDSSPRQVSADKNQTKAEQKQNNCKNANCIESRCTRCKFFTNSVFNTLQSKQKSKSTQERNRKQDIIKSISFQQKDGFDVVNLLQSFAENTSKRMQKINKNQTIHSRKTERFKVISGHTRVNRAKTQSEKQKRVQQNFLSVKRQLLYNFNQFTSQSIKLIKSEEKKLKMNKTEPSKRFSGYRQKIKSKNSSIWIRLNKGSEQDTYRPWSPLKHKSYLSQYNKEELFG